MTKIIHILSCVLFEWYIPISTFNPSIMFILPILIISVLNLYSDLSSKTFP